MTSFATTAESLRFRKETSLTVIIREEVARMIEAGELLPGAWVNEAELAQRFGVSRGPVREACRGLEQAGLLHFVVNRGAFVRQIDATEAAELYDLRSALFALAGRTLAPIITKDGLAQLDGLTRAMEEAARLGDLEAYYPLNLQFHRAILELGGNKRLLNAYQNCVRELHLFRRGGLVTAERMTKSNAEHQAIVDVLRSRDGDKASRLMEAHVLRAKKRILKDAAS
ncbi:MAG TPA: FCD domain-containing protein [Stellaceae bacterium]|nr:FCD domain-containing protein [Stellaceae bacterium]